MTGFGEAYLAELAASLTMVMAGALRKKLRQPERQKALERAALAGLHALAKRLELPGPEGENHAKSLLEWLVRGDKAGSDFSREVVGLLGDKALEAQTLREILADAGFEWDHFPSIDFEAAVRAFEAAYVQAVAAEKELQGEIQVEHLRQQTRLLAEILAETKKRTTPPPPTTSAARHQYLEALRRECRDLHLVDLGGRGGLGAEEITLDRVFIALDTQSQVAVRSEAGTAEIRSVPVDLEELQPLPALAAARRAKRLVLLGDPGSGKSSFVKELCFRLANHQLTGGPGPFESAADGLLPVYLECRPLARALAGLDLEDKDGTDRRRALAETVGQVLNEQLATIYKVPGFAGELAATLAGGRCLLVLDGLDEVPVDLRSAVREAVSALLGQALERVIVTCRIRSYEGEAVLAGFEPHTLAPLDKERIRHFVQAWYAALHELGRLEGQDWEVLGEDLEQAALDEDLGGLASNPMLLTTMALLHQEGAKLPPERARLFALALEVLALKWKGGDQRRAALSPELRALLGKNLELWQVLQRLGFEVHQAEALAGSRGERDPGTLNWSKAVEILAEDGLLKSRQLAIEFLAYVDQSAGVLVGRGGPPGQPAAYGFPHRFFQEYLAGRYLFRVDETADAIRARAAEGDFWQQAVALGAEDYLYCNTSPGGVAARAMLLCPTGASAATPQEARAALWAGSMAALVGEPEFLSRAPSFLDHLKERLVEVLTGPTLPARERVEAGRALGRLGDPRESVKTAAGMEFCWVPAGPFFMGQDPARLYECESRGGYWMGRYPVTHAQYTEYLEAASREGEVPRDPKDDLLASFMLANHPVVEVSWHEALAYCRWLTEKARGQGWIPATWGFSLPSEPEWEKAARGGAMLPASVQLRRLAAGIDVPGPPAERLNEDAERVYPFVGGFHQEKMNGDRMIGPPNAAGAYPAGRSPYGCEELAGGVREWSRSLFGPYPYPAKLSDLRQREALEPEGDPLRVLRGGSFAYDRPFVRCFARYRIDPDGRYRYIGFRVVLLPYFSEL